MYLNNTIKFVSRNHNIKILKIKSKIINNNTINIFPIFVIIFFNYIV